MPPVSYSTNPPVKEISIPVPWGEIKGKWWGSQDVRPILALHGWQDNAGSFDNLAQHLVSHMSILSLDLPGHGRSSHFPKGMIYYLFWDTLVTIRRVVKHFKWDKVSIMGHSMGGAGGFLYASIYPDEIDKLIELDIVCPRVVKVESVIKETPDFIDKFLKYEMSEDKGYSEEFDKMAETAHAGYNGSITEESCEILMLRGLTLVDRARDLYQFSRDPRLKVAGLAMLSREEVLAHSSRIKCEYLNIRANPGLKFDIPELYGQCLGLIKESAKRFEYHIVSGTHHVHLNDPKPVADLIINFILNIPNPESAPTDTVTQ